jgi:hypothetical protein
MMKLFIMQFSPFSCHLTSISDNSVMMGKYINPRIPSDVLQQDMYIYIYITMDLGEIGCDGLDWIGLPQARDNWSSVVNAAMNLGVS